MIPRRLEAALKKAAAQYPVVTVTGPRQSGKTTLVRSTFPDYQYVSLEDPDQREFASEDPRGFLGLFKTKAVLDEAQRVPDLFSYIQTIVDKEDMPGKFILSGSQNFLLLDRISQSLAGRCAVLHLLPFSMAELRRERALRPEQLGRNLPESKSSMKFSLEDLLFHGFFPRIHDKGLDPRDWLANYYRTYIERDVREIVNVGDIEAFGRFVRMSAARNGQLLNLSSLANDCGISHTTAKRWVSILETSFIVRLLRPHFKNYGKRLVKSPKIYFLDTGLLCFLLGVRSSEELQFHALRGSIFESLILSELFKRFFHGNEEPNLYFWRDATGHEIDILMDWGRESIALEIKSGRTVTSDFFTGIEYWRKLSGSNAGSVAVIYGGDTSFKRKGTLVYSWKAF